MKLTFARRNRTKSVNFDSFVGVQGRVNSLDHSLLYTYLLAQQELDLSKGNLRPPCL